MGVTPSSLGIGAGVGAALLIGIAIGVALPEPAAVPVSLPTPAAPPLPSRSHGSRLAEDRLDAKPASTRPRPSLMAIAEAGFDPGLLSALHAATAADPRAAAIAIRIVSADRCGPTPAPGSDCLVDSAFDSAFDAGDPAAGPAQR